jgi:TPR repeat protein
MYGSGRGVPQDHIEAAFWYSRSALQGYKYAQYNLGLMFDKGEGVPQDYKVAAHWYKKAAEQGFASAQYFLAFMHVVGQGVIKDDVEAYAWWNVSAAQGYEDAGNKRDLISKKMTSAQIEKVQELSKVYYQKYVK